MLFPVVWVNNVGDGAHDFILIMIHGPFPLYLLFMAADYECTYLLNQSDIFWTRDSQLFHIRIMPLTREKLVLNH